MISWSYYGEQGVVYLFGSSPRVVLVYRLLYCLLVFVSTLPFISTDQELDMWTTLGLGAMLVVNVPIMLVFGREAMSEYRTYIGKLKRGEFHSHAAQRLTDLVSGDDVKRD
jgi:AGCS family alanine or glycine:cation symporter